LESVRDTIGVWNALLVAHARRVDVDRDATGIWQVSGPASARGRPAALCLTQDAKKYTPELTWSAISQRVHECVQQTLVVALSGNAVKHFASVILQLP
jgi:hypothetical protein